MEFSVFTNVPIVRSLSPHPHSLQPPLPRQAIVRRVLAGRDDGTDIAGQATFDGGSVRCMINIEVLSEPLVSEAADVRLYLLLRLVFCEKGFCIFFCQRPEQSSIFGCIIHQYSGYILLGGLFSSCIHSLISPPFVPCHHNTLVVVSLFQYFNPFAPVFPPKSNSQFPPNNRMTCW